jgi:hypothetical protein
MPQGRNSPSWRGRPGVSIKAVYPWSLARPQYLQVAFIGTWPAIPAAEQIVS